MNKTALKNFATSARRELLQRVELQARKVGITLESIQKAQFESSDAIFIDGKQLSEKERVQRNKLITRIGDIGFDRVMEETAYTWFNRFTALRFMEVNDYLPTKVRVLSSINPESAESDMLKEALSLDLDLDKEYVYELKMTNNNEELFKYLIIKHCNDLNRYMPFMFETIDDYTEILFPEGLLATDSCIRRMTNIDVIPESNWEKIEVIGWLYQYYIVEEKNRVFKAKKKYKAEEIPFATQLFTPDWIVQYMVQNSLGRYWVEANPAHQDLISGWKFYLQNTEEGFEERIAPYINKEMKVEEIKCFDPAMGSGHILVYMFDVLYEIYSKSGYMEREIPRLIIENNLFGLDIDDRAYQLASFSVVMKALKYNKRFLRSIERDGLTLNLASIQETNTLTKEDADFLSEDSSENLEKTKIFIKQFKDAKTIGSLIKLMDSDTNHLQKRLESIQATPVTSLFEIEQREKALSLLPKLIKQAQIMSLKFDILVTNPPYMGSGSMNKELGDYLKKNYPASKADSFAAFMEINHYLKNNALYATINQHQWMFISNFEQLRLNVIKNKTIENMLHLGPRAFEEIGGEVVQSTTFVTRNYYIPNYRGTYLRLINQGTSLGKKEKTQEAVNHSDVNYNFSFNQENYKNIPGSPIVYWLKNADIFQNSKIKDTYFSGGRNKTHDNKKYVRYFWEVPIGNSKWISYTNGGEYKKYYGNDIYVVNWSDEARGFYEDSGGLVNRRFWGKEGITWNLINSVKSGFRVKYPDSQYSSGAPTIFNEKYEMDYYLLGFLNSNVAQNLLRMLNPTLNTKVGDVLALPYLESEYRYKVIDLVSENIDIAKFDWDSSEATRGFNKHPLILFKNEYSLIENSFEKWSILKENKYNKFKQNEEELNRIFIEEYGFQNELTYKVEDKDITIGKANLQEDIKSFISYAIGCAFGRFSLEEEGNLYDSEDISSSCNNGFKVDKDNVIPILPTAYFEDDIVLLLVEFLKLTYGERLLARNLNFVAEAIGKRGNEDSKQTIRRYLINDFYKKHVKTYKGCPIYWFFTSGKEKAFNCLVYMHRYDITTLSRIRTDYLHEVQVRMDAEKKDLLNIIDGDSTTKEISNAKKELKSLDKKIDELKAYDEKLHHMADMHIEIDLDDGVAINYAKFEGLVAKI